MVTHVAYMEEEYSTAERCVAAIREYVARGWNVSQLRGPASGPFVVVYRMEDEERLAAGLTECGVRHR